MGIIRLKQKYNAGFTLIELAVVIIIIAVLASVAVPRLVDFQRIAQATVAKDMLNVLRSGAAIYAAQNNKIPNDFGDFVTEGPMNAASESTVSLAQFGKGQCNVNGATINCPATAFSELSAFSYTFTSADQIELNCADCN